MLAKAGGPARARRRRCRHAAASAAAPCRGGQQPPRFEHNRGAGLRARDASLLLLQRLTRAQLAAKAVSGISTLGFVQSWFRNVDAMDLRTALLKSFLSGYLVALVCYHLGTGPKRSGADVGESVNRAIVLAMGLALSVHAVLTVAVYA